MVGSNDSLKETGDPISHLKHPETFPVVNVFKSGLQGLIPLVEA